MATAVLTTTQTVSAAAPSPAAPGAPSKQKLRIRIDNKWYDLTAWQKQHPGGADILHYLNNQDATDAFYSLHSDDAINRLNKMYSTPITKEDVTPLTEVQSFRTLREKLREEGWFQRNAFWEAFYILSVYTMCSVGSYLALHGHPIMAIGLIGLAMQQAGWIGHDYVHGRGDWSYYQGRWMGGLVNGFSSKWWSNKHNTHHCYTNHVGIDEDIANEPIFYLFYPDASNDTPYRQYQHLYMVPVYSFLYVSWRLQSIKYAYAQQNWTELAFIAINYAWLAWLPWYVSVGSILLGGLLVAVVVTASHQSEDMFDGEAMPSTAYNFIRTQFESTRDAITENFLLEYLWGGMQYQLEHHLFPTMPKYRYASLRPVIKQWAEANGLPYKAESSKEIMIRNYQTIKAFAKQVSTKDE